MHVLSSSYAKILVARIDILTILHCEFCNVTKKVLNMDLRDLRLFVYLAEHCHFGQTATAMHISPSTLSRQIQRLEDEVGHALFIRDNRSVTLTDSGEKLKQFAQQTLLQYQQLRHSMDINSPSLSGELHLFCSVTASYSHLPPILDRFRAEHPQVEIKLTTGDPADAVQKVSSGQVDLSIAGKPESLPTSIGFTPLGLIPLVLAAPALPCPVYRQLMDQPEPNWEKIPFILPEQGPARRSLDRWLRKRRINNPIIYATVSGHEAMVSMIALGCGIAILPGVVLENSPDPLRHRVMTLEIDDLGPPLDLGVCVRRQRLHEPLIKAFWSVL